MTPMHKLGMLALLGALPLVAYAQDAQLTDPQIAAVVVTANQVDIDAGKLANDRSQTKGVQDFSKLMIADHTSVNKAAVELANKLKIKPEQNATSEALKKEGHDNMAKLGTLEGHEFDKAYIDHEVAYHQEVLDAMDKTLIPSAKNEELKALLLKARPNFVTHLEHARQLQSTVGASSGKSAY